jgi:hypothetical protein
MWVVNLSARLLHPQLDCCRFQPHWRLCGTNSLPQNGGEKNFFSRQEFNSPVLQSVTSTLDWRLATSVAYSTLLLCYIRILMPKYSQYSATRWACLYHHDMTCLAVAEGGKFLEIWSVAANIMNKESQIAEKGWSSSLLTWWGLTTVHHETSKLRNVSQDLRIAGVCETAYVIHFF